MQPNSGVDPDTAPSDAELIARVRDGDRSAFGDLYGRHARAANALARQLSVSGAEADDLVAESFARVLDTLLDGRGPDSAFRAYLFTTLRHTAYDRTRKDKRLTFTDDIAAHDVAVEGDDPVLLQMENSFVAKAFGQLPERWQTILWHTQVEGQTPAEVGVLLGMTSNAVTSLAFRAREGLREAYLQVHMNETVAERCRTTIDRLGAYTRGGLSKRENAQVQAHLNECDRCPALAAELSEINSGLRGLLAPLLLGTAAAGYIATLPAVPVLTQVGAQVAATGAGVGVGAGKLSVVSKVIVSKVIASKVIASKVGKQFAGTSAAAGGSVAAAVIVVIAVVIAVASGGGKDTAGPLADQIPSTAAAGNAAPPGAAPPAGVGGSSAGAPSPPVQAADSAAGSAADSTGASTAAESPGSPAAQTTTSATTTSATTPAATAARIPPVAIQPPSNQVRPPPGTSPRDTPPPDTPPTNAPPTDTPPTDTPPIEPPPVEPAVVSGSFVSASGSLTAGKVETINLALTNSGGTAQPADVATLTADPGLTIVGADLVTPGLRAPLVAFAAGGAASPLSCNATSCALPELAPGTSETITVRIGVSPDATSGSMAWTAYGVQLTGQPEPLPITSGLISVAVFADALRAGRNVNLTIATTLAPGVTDAGSIELPRRLADGITVYAADNGCTTAGTTVTCGSAGGILHAAALPGGSTTTTVSARLPGNRAIEVTLPTVGSAPPGSLLNLTGQFGGTAAGAELMRCEVREADSRASCGGGGAGGPNAGMRLVNKPQTVTIPVGATVLRAELTWAATAPLPGTSLARVTFSGAPAQINGLRISNAEGFISAYAADVTKWVSGSGTFSVTDLPASTVPGGTRRAPITPFAAWTLVVVWSDPSGPVVTVHSANQTIRSLPGMVAGDTIDVIRTSEPLTELYVALWATDPWGMKSLFTDTGVTLAPQVTGTENGFQTGFDFFAFTDKTGLSGATTVRLSNRRLIVPGHVWPDDGLWVGPVLAISSAVDPAPAG